MKKHLLFLLLLMSVWMMMACRGDKHAPGPCRMTVKVDFPDYTQAYLKTTDGKVLDTLLLKDGQTDFLYSDTARMPFVAFVSLVNPWDSLDRMDMPVVVESGKVGVEVGEYIVAYGTPLNVRLQEFLNDLQAASDAVKGPEVTVEESRKVFSQFYRQQILGNRHNVVGRFIYRNYGVHLNEEDAALVKAQLGN